MARPFPTLPFPSALAVSTTHTLPKNEMPGDLRWVMLPRKEDAGAQAVSTAKRLRLIAPVDNYGGHIHRLSDLLGGRTMLTLGLTVLILMVVYFLQQAHPLLAGMLAVAPVKIVATSFMVLEEGGVPRLQEAIAGMLIGQLVWSVALIAVWLALR